MIEVTTNEYADAVARLVPVAMSDTGGGRAAAQVLLSTYNSYAFHLDPTDLCNLDQENLRAALTVIHGRAILRYEPHELIVDGGKHFERLRKQWEHLSINQRYTNKSH